MKRAQAFFLLITILITITSCGKISHSPYQLMDDFLSVYRGTGTVYSPKCTEGEAGFVTDEICQQFFTNIDLAPLDYAIYSHSRLDGVTEVGFLTSTGTLDMRDVLESALERVDFLRGFYRGDGGAMIHGGVIIYYFSADEGVLSAIKKIT